LSAPTIVPGPVQSLHALEQKQQRESHNAGHQIGNTISAKIPKIPLTSRGARSKAIYVRRMGEGLGAFTACMAIGMYRAFNVAVERTEKRDCLPSGDAPLGRTPRASALVQIV